MKSRIFAPKTTKNKAMAKKKGPSMVSKSNELVQSFTANKNADFILNPISYTHIRGNFSLAQTNLMIAIIAQLQDRIKEQLMIGEGTSLFKPEDYQGNLLNFEIPLKELGVSPKKYGELEAACEALLHVDMSYKRYDEKEKVEYNVKQNIFHKIEFPTSEFNSEGEKIAYKSGQRRKGVIKLQIVDESAREILNLRKGYTRHLRGIAALCRSPRTPRLYIYLSAWRKVGGCKVNYIDLKEFFGVLRFSNDHRRIIENKYIKYGAFHRDVLDPVEREMKKLAEEGKVEFYFEYSPVYPVGVTRGDPESISFRIIEGKLGKAQNYENFRSRLHSKLITRYSLQPSEWAKLEPLIWDGIELDDELKHIDKQIEEKQPDNVHAYATAILYEWLQQHKRPNEPEFDYAEEVKTPLERPIVAEIYRKRWNWWMDRCKERLGDDFFTRYMACSDLWAVRENYVFCAVPNQFVRDQWEARIAEVSSYFFTAFGATRKLVYTYEDLSKYAPVSEE